MLSFHCLRNSSASLVRKALRLYSLAGGGTEGPSGTPMGTQAGPQALWVLKLAEASGTSVPFLAASGNHRNLSNFVQLWF